MNEPYSAERCKFGKAVRHNMEKPCSLELQILWVVIKSCLKIPRPVDVICVKIPMCFLIGTIWSGRVRPLPGGAPLNLKTECSVVLHGLPTRPIVDIMKVFWITWQLFVRRFGLSRPPVGGVDRLLCEGDQGVVTLGSYIIKGFTWENWSLPTTSQLHLFCNRMISTPVAVPKLWFLRSCLLL